jgi:acyl carrier protein
LNNPDLGSSEIRDRIRRVFIESLRLNIRENELSYEDKLDEVAGMDSIAVLEFVTALEKEFDISFEPEMLTIDVVGDLTRLVDYVHLRTLRGRG